MQDMIAVLRSAIERDARTLYRIAKDCGLPYATVHRFARSERTHIDLVTAAKLCDGLGLALRPAGRQRKVTRAAKSG